MTKFSKIVVPTEIADNCLTIRSTKSYGLMLRSDAFHRWHQISPKLVLALLHKIRSCAVLAEYSVPQITVEFSDIFGVLQQLGLLELAYFGKFPGANFGQPRIDVLTQEALNYVLSNGHALTTVIGAPCWI